MLLDEMFLCLTKKEESLLQICFAEASKFGYDYFVHLMAQLPFKKGIFGCSFFCLDRGIVGKMGNKRDVKG